MSDWIQFGEGMYLAEQAFLAAPGGNAMPMADAVIEIYMGPGNKRRLKGSGKIQNALLVDLLEDNDKVDLVLDMGGEFKFVLPDPELKAGKVFAPDVQSTVQFLPKTPWKQISEEEFNQRTGQVL